MSIVTSRKHLKHTTAVIKNTFSRMYCCLYLSIRSWSTHRQTDTQTTLRQYMRRNTPHLSSLAVLAMWSKTVINYYSSSYTVKIICISYADILWRVFDMLTEPVPYTIVSVDRRINEARAYAHCNVAPRFIIPSIYAWQTYTEPVPLKYRKPATKYPWICGYFYSACRGHFVNPALILTGSHTPASGGPRKDISTPTPTHGSHVNTNLTRRPIGPVSK